MNEKEYLNQISSTARPEKKPKTNVAKSPFFKVIVIGLVGLIAIIVLGTVLGGGKGSIKSQLAALQLHLDNTSSLINEYQKSVKSSNLRSASASLKSVLTNTSREVSDYLALHSFKASSAEKNIKEQANLEKDWLDMELSEAKINGLLDRVFALKMKYEISTFMTEEIDIYNATDDEDLRGVLDSSYNSLKTLYERFNDFSETK